MIEPTLAGRNARLKKIAAWIALLTAALGVRVAMALLLPYVIHADENFQTLEPAHRLAYGYGIITWEWRMGIRSWVFPAFLAGVMRATAWMGAGNSGYLNSIIVLLSLGSLSTVWFGYAWAKRVSGTEAALIAAGASSFFFTLVLYAPKSLSEVVAAHLLLPGLYLGAFAEGSRERRRLFFAGVLCGLAAMLRIQILPAAAVAAVYFCYPRWRTRIPAVAAGFSLPVFAFWLVDKLTWSSAWPSCIRYFHANLIEGRAMDYGTKPWFWYLPVVAALLGPIVIFTLQGVPHSPLLAVLALLIVASHSVIAHKEIRYIYPALALLIPLAAIGYADTAAYLRRRWGLLQSSRAVVASGVLLFVLSSACVARFLLHANIIRGAQFAFNRLSRDENLCGVGVYGSGWGETGGYTHLHRDVPMIIPIRDGADLAAKAPEFNALVAPQAAPEVPAAFQQGECFRGVCVYRRAGACRPPRPGDTINELLQREGH